MVHSLPKISVIICTYSPNRSRDLLRAIDSVHGQTWKAREVLVVVDGKEELAHSLSAVVSPGVTLITNREPLGLSGARNTGVRAAQGEIVAFLDDDAWAEREWLECLALAFADANVVAVGGRIIPVWPEKRRPFWFPEEIDWVVGCSYAGLPLLPDGRVRNVIGCNMAFRRSVFERVGFFRSTLGRKGAVGQAEETDLCLRILDGVTGAVIRYEPAAVVYHRVTAERATVRFLLARSYHEGYCKALVRRLHADVLGGPLSSESRYLRHLVARFALDRVTSIFYARNFAQLVAAFLSVAAVGFGYLAGELVAARSGQVATPGLPHGDCGTPTRASPAEVRQWRRRQRR
jgi:GT2 family glycosyltransferase